jgi:hypothetical protein
MYAICYVGQCLSEFIWIFCYLFIKKWNQVSPIIQIIHISCERCSNKHGDLELLMVLWKRLDISKCKLHPYKFWVPWLFNLLDIYITTHTLLTKKPPQMKMVFVSKYPRYIIIITFIYILDLLPIFWSYMYVTYDGLIVTKRWETSVGTLLFIL